MTDRWCANCLYAYWSTTMKWNYGPDHPFPVGPVCSNHPDAPGRLREVPAGGICRNYRPRPPAPPEETVRRIMMSGGQFVLVDAADYEWLSRHKWSSRNGYATRRAGRRLLYMHREIMNPPPGMVVDHIDGNKPNNCRSNLRICTRQENLQNRPKRIDCVSRFKGVHYHKRSGKWHAQADLAGEYFRTRLFADEVEAARAYDRLAVELFGEFAYLNFPEDWPPERRQEAFARKETVNALRQAKAERAERRKARAEKAKTGQGKGKKAKGETRNP